MPSLPLYMPSQSVLRGVTFRDHLIGGNYDINIILASCLVGTSIFVFIRSTAGMH
jgi:hypothetical protein